MKERLKVIKADTKEDSDLRKSYNIRKIVIELCRYFLLLFKKLIL